jgi:acyl-CoA thioesterase
MREHYFINPDLHLAIHREPEGEWIALDAAGIAEESGIGLATTRLFDTTGEIGVVTQTMVIESR